MRVSEGETLTPRCAPWLQAEVVRREYAYTYLRWIGTPPDGERLSAYRHKQLPDLFRRAA